MKRVFLTILLVFVLFAGCVPAVPDMQESATATPQPGALVVDADKDLGPISPYLYGTNYGPWTAVPADMLQAAFDSKITTLRWPGGRWGNENDIQTYQLDMFIDFCKKMGAMPTIHVRFQGGSPEAAAELVRYANIEKKYGITYWAIGNEPDYETWNGKKIDPAEFNPLWRKMAQAMKAVDPTIKIMGPELSQWGTTLSNTPKYPSAATPSANERQDWMTEFLKANGDLVDIVTVHRYPLYDPSSTSPITVESLRRNTLEWQPMVTYLRGLIKQITGRDLPVGFTEVNSDPSGVFNKVASPDSYYNAIWYADVLGRMIEENVFIIDHFVLANRQSGHGLIYNSELRPTYYVFQMYSHFGSQRVYSSSGVEFVTIYAAKRPDGTLTIMVINLTDSEQRLPLDVRGMKVSKAQVWLFDATHNAVDMGLQEMPSDDVLTLPAQSISLYAIPK
jgi:hypothetical protein